MISGHQPVVRFKIGICTVSAIQLFLPSLLSKGRQNVKKVHAACISSVWQRLANLSTSTGFSELACFLSLLPYLGLNVCLKPCWGIWEDLLRGLWMAFINILVRMLQDWNEKGWFFCTEGFCLFSQVVITWGTFCVYRAIKWGTGYSGESLMFAVTFVKSVIWHYLSNYLRTSFHCQFHGVVQL